MRPGNLSTLDRIKIWGAAVFWWSVILVAVAFLIHAGGKE